MNKYRFLYNIALSLIINLLLVMGYFILCRAIFLIENPKAFPDLSAGRIWRMLEGGFLLDTSVIPYTNLLYIFLMLTPLHYKENITYQKITKGIFVTIDLTVITMNPVDTVYFQYTHRRTTASVFNEFKNEGDLGGIIGTELLNHWYLTLFAIAFGYALSKLYRKPKPVKVERMPVHYMVHLFILGLGVYLCIGGMRDGFTGMTRPATVSNANKYVDRPMEAGIVLSTPFSVFRTFGKTPFAISQYFDKEKMEALYTPVHMPADSVQFGLLNAVVFIPESLSEENSGSLNEELDNGTYKGYMPFLDSLMVEGLTFKYSFSNGMKSIGGMSSVLSDIPMFIESFFLTPSSLNVISSIGGELGRKGYHTIFFYGADNGSMGFEAFARTAGYTNHLGRTEHNEVNPGNKDSDGHWGIWDEEFFQFFGNILSGFQQPFTAVLFSLSSHHPLAVPAEYEGVFPRGNKAVCQCAGYTDHALKLFFEKVPKEPWYKNTLFAFTVDHTNSLERPECETESGLSSVPVVLYQPGSNSKGFRKDVIVQQIDVMSTVLGYLGYDKPFVSFGRGLLNTPAEDTYAVNCINGIYQFFKGDYLLQFDGRNAVAVYAFKTDKSLEYNPLGQIDAQQSMEDELKVII